MSSSSLQFPFYDFWLRARNQYRIVKGLPQIVLPSIFTSWAEIRLTQSSVCIQWTCCSRQIDSSEDYLVCFSSVWLVCWIGIFCVYYCGNFVLHTTFIAIYSLSVVFCSVVWVIAGSHFGWQLAYLFLACISTFFKFWRSSVKLPKWTPRQHPRLRWTNQFRCNL